MRRLSIVLAIALVVVAGLAVRFSREAEAGRQHIAELAVQLQLQLQQVEAAAEPVAQAAQPGAATLSVVKQAQEAAMIEPPPDGSAEVRASVRAFSDTIRAQMFSPESQARRRETARLLMGNSFPDLEEALGLAPDEVGRLLDLLANQQERTFGEARDARDPLAPMPRTATEYEELRARNQAELQELLGPKYPQWQDYQQTSVVWQQRRDLRVVLDAAGMPLTAAQSQALIAALSAEQRSINQTQQAARLPFSQYTPERNERLLNAASPHLTALQLESYRQMLDRAAEREQGMGALSGRAAAAAATSEASQR